MRALLKFDRVIFIGAGGTNGYAIPSILRMLSFSNITNPNFDVIIADNDIIENKNIARQNFIYSDIGKYKAEVMALRYGTLFNIRTRFINERIDKNKLSVLINNSYGFYRNVLIIEAVDNNASRLMIKNTISSSNMKRNVYWLSSGNSDKDGQVILSMHSKYMNTRTVVDIWPEAFTKESLKAEADREEAANCAVNAVVNPQSIAINETAASILRNITYSLIYDKTIENTVYLFDRMNNINNLNLAIYSNFQ